MQFDEQLINSYIFLCWIKNYLALTICVNLHGINPGQKWTCWQWFGIEKLRSIDGINFRDFLTLRSMSACSGGHRLSPTSEHSTGPYNFF